MVSCQLCWPSIQQYPVSPAMEDYALRHVHLDSAMLLTINKLCRRPPQYAPTPCKLTFWTWKWCPSHVGYLCANFSLPRPLCSRLRPHIHDRQTDSLRCAPLLNAPYPRGGA